MEPVTHFLTGAVLARTGFNRRTAYATLAMTLAAEAADLDILWGFAGPVAGFAHHRGITHTFLGAPVVAAVVTGAVWLLHRYRKKKPALAPRWGLLWLFSLLAALSHILLDWTNNYGVRPLFPFNPHWYSADLVFIVEPLLLIVLTAALVLPWIFRLADREMGVRSTVPAGRGWAMAALLAMLALWGWRAEEHARVLAQARNLELVPGEVLRVAAEPYPVNPFRWHLVEETSDSFLAAEANSRTGEIAFDPRLDTVAKPQVTLPVLAAKRSLLGRVYLDWAQFPVVEDFGALPVDGVAAPPPGVLWTTVGFRDMRYAYQPIGLGMAMDTRASQTHLPLTAWIYVRNGDQVEAQIMSGREQK